MKITLQNKSLLDIRSEFLELFYKQDWYEDESFAKEKFSGTWEVDLEPVKGSLNKTWDEQQKIIKTGNEVPPVAVLAYAMCKHFNDTGERAFERVYARTSSVGSDGGRVYVGGFAARGLGVGYGWDDDRDSGLGVSSARKLNIEHGELDSFSDLELRVRELEAWQKRVMGIGE